MDLPMCVTIPSLPKIKLQRSGDVCIMNLPAQNFTASQTRQINACRVYLRALTIIDITSLCGTEITSGAWMGTLICSSSLSWQYHPKLPAWNLWKTFLCYALTRDEWKLLTPLGRWYHQKHHLEHRFLYNKSHNMIYIYHNTQWWEHHNKRQLHFGCKGVPVSAHPVGVPVSIRTANEYIAITMQSFLLQTDDSPCDPKPCIWSALGEHIYPNDDGQQLWWLLAMDHVLIASNGSYKNECGSFAYYLQITDKQTYFSGG